MLAAMLSVSGLELTDNEKYLLSQSNPLGISLFGRNIANKEQLKKLIKNIKETIGRDNVLIAIDQEGGRVRRLAEPHWPTYLSQSELDATSAKYHAQLISQDLHEVGINWNYAPVLDLAFENTTTALLNRCFSSSEKQVTKLGKIMLEEYIKAGICPCIKHMPGHGRATVDPHLHLPILDFSLQELSKDFYPFQALAKEAPAGMTAHIIIPEVDDKLPITQSKKAIDTIIRGLIGFDGLLISDAIDMKALKGSIGEKTKTSLEAGCDCICYCHGIYEELLDVISNCTQMNDISLERFNKIQTIFKNRNTPDTNAKDYYKITSSRSYSLNYDATEVLHQLKKKPL